MAAEDSEPEAYFSAEEEGGERNDNASDEVEGVDEKSDREGAAANNDEEKLIEKLTPEQWKVCSCWTVVIKFKKFQNIVVSLHSYTLLLVKCPAILAIWF